MIDGKGLDLLAVEAFTWTPTLETVCEICLRYALDGRRVGFAFLDIENVDQFPEMVGARIGSAIYASRRKARMKRVREIEALLRSRGVEIIPTVSGPDPVPGLTATQAGIDSIESLLKFRLGDAALGFGVLSTLIRLTGDSEPDFATSRALIDRILNSAHLAFGLTSQLIDQWRPEEVLLYNGRLAVTKAISEAARLASVGVLHHEIASTKDRFYLSPDAVHNQRLSRRRMRALWDSAGDGREAVAEKYFQPRRGGIRLYETKPLEHRKRDQELPATGRWRIVYFTSSIEEFAAIEHGFEDPLFESQQKGAAWLASWVAEQPAAELVIRMHPRARNMSSRERNWWNSLAAENVTVLSPDSRVDSYALAISADRVVVHHTSIGAEAAYLGRISILVGDADYRGLDCVYEPATTDELAEMLLDPSLQPKPRSNCLPFGYQRLMRGERYRFYQPETFYGGSFFGQPITPHREDPIYLARLVRGLLRVQSVGGHRIARSVGLGATGANLSPRS